MGQKVSVAKAKSANDLWQGTSDIDMKLDKNIQLESQIIICKNISKMESLHKDAQKIFPNVFEGVKALINVTTSARYSADACFSLGPSEKSSGNYLKASYYGKDRNLNEKVYPYMFGEINPNGQLKAQISHNLLNNLYFNYIAEMRVNKIDEQQVSFNYESNNLNASITLDNPSIVNQQFNVSFDVMRRLTTGLSLGSKAKMKCIIQDYSYSTDELEIGGKYVGNDWISTASVNPFHKNLHCTYLKKLFNDSIDIASEVKVSLVNRSCVASAGYQFISKTGSIIKCKLDSNWKIGSSYEFKTEGIPLNINLCTTGDLWKSVYGIGIEFKF